MATLDIAGGRRVPRRFSAVLSAALLSAIVVVTGAIIFLSKDLPEASADTLQYPVADFNFAFGSGNLTGDLMFADHFANGYALLSSGPVGIQADKYRVLGYTWLPPRMTQESAFFWRRADAPQDISRTEITVPGTGFIDLSTEPEWRGEIIEFGFLVAGEDGKPVGIGEASLIPDNLGIRLQLTWKAWISFEEWSQRSINLLYGGDYRQLVALPLLVAAWLGFTLLFTWLLQRWVIHKVPGSRRLLKTATMLFLLAWVLLDLRWAVNNIRQTRLSLVSHWQENEQQRLGSGLDGEIYQYVQRLKAEVLDNHNARILIIGDETADDYYLLRAKYHLLPHSVSVAGGLVKELVPESLDFVLFFGQPANIVKVPGWNPTWQDSLVRTDSGELATVFRVSK